MGTKHSCLLRPKNHGPNLTYNFTYKENPQDWHGRNGVGPRRLHNVGRADLPTWHREGLLHFNTCPLDDKGTPCGSPAVAVTWQAVKELIAYIPCLASCHLKRSSLSLSLTAFCPLPSCLYIHRFEHSFFVVPFLCFK